jgi:HEAT repeat protein
LKLLNGEDPLGRSWAAWGLGQLRDRRAVDALIENLNYPNKNVIVACIRALGEIGDPRAAPRLAFRLYTNPLDREKQIEQEPAAEALVKLGPPAVDALIEVLRGKIDDMRQRAAVVLGRIGDPRAVAALVEVLGQDASLALRSAVVEALALIRDPSVVAPLADVLAKEAGPGKFRLWKAAAQGLQRQGCAPKNDATAAAYWLAQGDLDKCVAVGAPQWSACWPS